jgi:hypothetical protein
MTKTNALHLLPQVEKKSDKIKEQQKAKLEKVEQKVKSKVGHDNLLFPSAPVDSPQVSQIQINSSSHMFGCTKKPR